MTSRPLPDPPTPANAVRAGHFSFHEPMLLFPKVQLFEDRLDFGGWHLRGRYHRQIPLKRILQVEVTAGGRLLVWLHNGESLRLRVDDPEQWKRDIEHYRVAR